MDREHGWVVIEQARRQLADLLDSVPETDWDKPSLCDGWRIRDVAAHVLLAPRHPGVGAMLAGAIRARGNLDRLSHDMTVAYAEKMGDGLVAGLRAHAASRRKPPVTTYENLLFDTLVHVQDVAIPLGRTVPMPVDAARAGADRVWAMGWPVWAKRKFAKGYRLVAEDTDWTAGRGPLEIRGPIESLLLLLTGRAAAVDRLSGDGISRLGVSPPRR
jgi:uncharacterized protein (TIGR03083 family)